MILKSSGHGKPHGLLVFMCKRVISQGTIMVRDALKS